MGKFFGPFPNSYAVRDALKLIQKIFKLRNCSDSYFKTEVDHVFNMKLEDVLLHVSG